ncbi:hypothetical protein FDH38_gp016 [Dinoroseobacter phage vB_DshS-R5C]|uniref:Uncharacterized protein n=1 Tax=Dinoroseobacter phage vB_DshS-R5C TaxID=1965368 RepID=A0A1V0DY62_9CAUD|nr:hypothetical protein FDH38_gp016 [Dinoroseobacter phage vB_DshS-R5C]ARB06070.1 hypothetical protein vBDshSR5C_16 [Dinoroseobacter phage vB_DshS-R5C]
MSNQQSFMPDEVPKNRAFKRRTPKPIIVEWRAKGGRSLIWFRDWSKFGRYKDRATAEQVLRQKAHDKHFEYRIKENPDD